MVLYVKQHSWAEDVLNSPLPSTVVMPFKLFHRLYFSGTN